MDETFDTALALARKLRATAQPLDGADFLAVRVAEDMADRLSAIDRTFALAALIHCRSGEGYRTLKALAKADQIITVEAHKAMPGHHGGVLCPPEIVALEPASIDLAISLLSLHEANDTPGMMIQMRQALKPDGLLIAAMAGAGTLNELRECLLAAETELTGGASPRVYPFADVRAAGALLQRCGFALPVTDTETYMVRYDSIYALMADLRSMGATSALTRRSRKPATRALFHRAGEIYAERFADPDGRIRATFEIVWMSGWVPHASQQKPSRRGSATQSLESALNNPAPKAPK